MLPIVWRATAQDDLTQIIQHIASINPIAATRMKRLLEDSIVPASEHPYLYRRSERVDALREIVAHPNYIVLYRIMTTCIEVVNVVHVRREFP